MKGIHRAQSRYGSLYHSIHKALFGRLNRGSHVLPAYAFPLPKICCTYNHRFCIQIWLSLCEFFRELWPKMNFKIIYEINPKFYRGFTSKKFITKVACVCLCKDMWHLGMFTKFTRGQELKIAKFTLEARLLSSVEFCTMIIQSKLSAHISDRCTLKTDKSLKCEQHNNKKRVKRDHFT